jgi:hypothetical protein
MKKKAQLKQLTEQDLRFVVGASGEATPNVGGFKPGGPFSRPEGSPQSFVRTYGPILN